MKKSCKSNTMYRKMCFMPVKKRHEAHFLFKQKRPAAASADLTECISDAYDIHLLPGISARYL